MMDRCWLRILLFVFMISGSSCSPIIFNKLSAKTGGCTYTGTPVLVDDHLYQANKAQFLDNVFVTDQGSWIGVGVVYLSTTIIGTSVTNGSNALALIRRSNDEGATWTTYTYQLTNNKITKINGIIQRGNSLLAYGYETNVIGLKSALILESTNDGITWNKKSAFSDGGVSTEFSTRNSAWVADDGTIYLGYHKGNIGHLAKSTDGGASWSNVTSFLVANGSSSTIQAVREIDATHLLILGSSADVNGNFAVAWNLNLTSNGVTVLKQHRVGNNLHAYYFDAIAYGNGFYLSGRDTAVDGSNRALIHYVNSDGSPSNQEIQYQLYAGYTAGLYEIMPFGNRFIFMGYSFDPILSNKGSAVVMSFNPDSNTPELIQGYRVHNGVHANIHGHAVTPEGDLLMAVYSNEASNILQSWRMMKIPCK
jgi:hypothetical protein